MCGLMYMTEGSRGDSRVRWQCHGCLECYLKGRVEPGKGLSRAVAWSDWGFMKIFRLVRGGMDRRLARREAALRLELGNG